MNMGPLKDLVDKLKYILHDVKNLMFVLEMNLKGVQKKIEEGDTAAALELIARGFTYIETTRNTISEKEEHKEKIYLCVLIRELLEDIKVKNIRIGFDFQQGEKYVFMKKSDMFRILHNILNNAIQALEGRDGGIVDIAVKQEYGQIHIIMYNNGPHIPIKGEGVGRLSYICERGYTTKDTGEGIGLDVVKTVVKTNEGKLVVRNVSTGGVEFVVILPEYKDDVA